MVKKQETTDSIISKMLLNLSCLVSDRSSAMKQEKKNLKKIFLLSVYKEIRSVSILQKNLVTIIQNISES